MIALMLLPVYIIINIYIFWRLHRWITLFDGPVGHRYFRITICAIFVILSSTMLIGFLLHQGNAAKIFKVIGNYWAAVQIFSLPVLGIFEILLFFRKKQFPDETNREKNKLFAKKVGAVCLSAIIVLSLWGSVNSRIIRTTYYNIRIDKHTDNIENLRIVLLSDLHLGINSDCKQIGRLVAKINKLKPDIVLIAGDIFDNNFESIEEPDKMTRLFKKIHSKYGTYACYGNHDIEEKILAGFTFSSDKPKISSPEMDDFLVNSNIKLLKDQGTIIDDSFYLYGRPDSERPGSGITKRKTPNEITSNLDKEMPIIVLDHQPKELEELSRAGVDLDLSGHTHGGQIFPGNLLIGFFWKNPYGEQDIGKMKSIVSTGVGNIGPNVRLGAKAEICLINVDFSFE